MFLLKLKSHWWREPDLKPRKVRIPSHLKDLDPLSTDYELPGLYKGKIASFNPPVKWTYYNRLHGVDVNYIVRVYSLKEIGLRYGFSQNGMIYLRKHILPEPFDIVRRRSVHAHHWSRFTLMAMDVVLSDLHDRGYNQILKNYTDHVDLLHEGVAYLEQYYTAKYEEQALNTSDEFGVTWLTDSL